MSAFTEQQEQELNRAIQTLALIQELRLRCDKYRNALLKIHEIPRDQAGAERAIEIAERSLYS